MDYYNYILSDFFEKRDSTKDSLKTAQNLLPLVPEELKTTVWDLISYYDRISNLSDNCIEEQRKLASGLITSSLCKQQLHRRVRTSTFVIQGHFCFVRILVHKLKIRANALIDESIFLNLKRYF